jgi:hypothetical protein
MRALLFGLLIASLVLTTPGCAFFRALFGLDGPPEPTPEEVAAATLWENIGTARATITALPPATDDAAFMASEAAHADWHALLEEYASYCGDPVIGDQCDALANARAEQRAFQASTWAHGVDAPGVSFDQLQVLLLAHQKKDGWQTLLDLDALIPKLAAKQLARWVGELEAHRRPADYVRTSESALCLPLASERGRKPRKLVTMNFEYRAGDDIWIRCFVPKAPRSLRRDTNDTWIVKVRHEGRWETVLEQKIKRTSGAKTLHHQLDGETLQQALSERAHQQGWGERGGWFNLQVVYVVRAITTRRWVDGVWQDEWQEQTLGSTSFFMQLPPSTPEPPAPTEEANPAPAAAPESHTPEAATAEEADTQTETSDTSEEQAAPESQAPTPAEETVPEQDTTPAPGADDTPSP